MLTDHPEDTATHIWTERGLMARDGLAFGLSDIPSDCGGAVAHSRVWMDGDKVVRSDLWVEVLAPSPCSAAANQF